MEKYLKRCCVHKLGPTRTHSPAEFEPLSHNDNHGPIKGGEHEKPNITAEEQVGKRKQIQQFRVNVLALGQPRSID